MSIIKSVSAVCLSKNDIWYARRARRDYSDNVKIHDVNDKQGGEQELGAHLKPVESPPNRAGVVLARGDYAVS